MTIGSAVDARLIKVGDRLDTDEVGCWPGGPAVVTGVGAKDPNNPEIVAYVRHEDPAVRASHDDSMGLFDNENYVPLPPAPRKRRKVKR